MRWAFPLLGHLDVEQLAAFVVDLERGVFKLELVVQERFEVAAGGVAVVLGADKHRARRAQGIPR